MTESYRFRPPLKRGLLFSSTLALAFGATSAFAIFYGLNQQVGAYFVLLLLISLLLFVPVPLILYRIYALLQSSYQFDRDGLRLRWGLRAEDIPLQEIEWVRQASDLAADLHYPRLIWPGAIVGNAHGRDLGQVEFMAASSESMVLIATPKKVFAVSPENPDAFVRAFHLTLEMGSLSHFNSTSVLPAAYLAQVWSDPLARRILLAGLILSFLLFIGVSLIIPTRAQASLGFFPSGEPLPPGPAEQLLLLPILGVFIYLGDLAAGLFFYRKEQYQLVAYLLWGSGAASLALLIAAFIMIL